MVHVSLPFFTIYREINNFNRTKMDSKLRLFCSLILVVIVNLQEISGQNDSNSVRSVVLDKLLKSYNKDAYPYSDKPTEDRIGIYINAFSFKDVDMSYTITFYMRQSWKDPRLNFESSTVDSWDDISQSMKTDIENLRKIRMPTDKVDKLFIPDMFFRNSPSVESLLLERISHENTLLTINKTGHVWFVRKISASFSCPMKFQKFPFDTQMCPIMFESFGATMDSLYFRWLDSPVDVDPAIQLPQFTLTDIVLYDCSQNYTAGAFPCLEIRFALRRDSGYYILQIFIPSTIAVVMSWFMFRTDMESGMKVLTSVFLMACVIGMDGAVLETLPSVSYIKCVDIWFAACFLMIMLALVVAIRLNNDDDGKKKRIFGLTSEKIARIVVPAIFLVFIIIFAIIYSV